MVQRTLIAMLASAMISNSFHSNLFRRIPPSQLLFSTRPQKQIVDTSDFPPPPKNGNGEWSDWDSDAFVDSDGSELGALFGDDIKIPKMTTPEDADVTTVIQRPVSIMDDEDDDIPPPPTGSRGEWDDWTGKGQTFSPSSSPSSSSSSSSTWSPRKNEIGGPGKSASENWEGWSEDAPYFDEAEITDDEGNKGHFDDRPIMKSLGSSDLWTRVDRLKMNEPDTVTNENTSASTSTGTSTTFSQPPMIATGLSNMNSDYALTVILEMNRQFASLEAKTTLATENKDRKLDVLVAEITDLKRYLGIAFATMGVLIAKDIF